MQKQYQRWVSR